VDCLLLIFLHYIAVSAKILIMCVALRNLVNHNKSVFVWKLISMYFQFLVVKQSLLFSVRKREWRVSCNNSTLPVSNFFEDFERGNAG